MCKSGLYCMHMLALNSEITAILSIRLRLKCKHKKSWACANSYFQALVDFGLCLILKWRFFKLFFWLWVQVSRGQRSHFDAFCAWEKPVYSSPVGRPKMSTLFRYYANRKSYNRYQHKNTFSVLDPRYAYSIWQLGQILLKCVLMDRFRTMNLKYEMNFVRDKLMR